MLFENIRHYDEPFQSDYREMHLALDLKVIELIFLQMPRKNVYDENFCCNVWLKLARAVELVFITKIRVILADIFVGMEIISGMHLAEVLRRH